MARALMKTFGVGFIAGFVIAAVIFGSVAGSIYARNRDKELIKYVEKQLEIEVMREDYSNRDPFVFLEDPGVRGAADNAITDFQRSWDEVLQRFRNRLTH